MIWKLAGLLRALKLKCEINGQLESGRSCKSDRSRQFQTYFATQCPAVMTAPDVISAPPHLYAKLPFATRSWTYTVHGNSPKLAIPSSRCSIPSSSSMKCTRLAIAARRWPHFFGFGATGRGLVVDTTALLVEEVVAAGAGVTSKMNSASGSSCRSCALNS